jgi:acetoacetyl-CoA synthetase
MSCSALWKPTPKQIKNSNLHHFIKQLETNLGLTFDQYQQLHQWSVDETALFWQQLWDFTHIRHSKPYDKVLKQPKNFLDAKWFQGARLNYAENILRNRSAKTALVARLENGQRRTLSYAELYQQVAQLAAALRNRGVVKGDRVAGFLPNVVEAITAMLATSSIGAIWSSCSPDFGINGVMDRFGQITPKILFACEGYFYNGKTINSLPRVEQIKQQIGSIEQLVLVTVTENRPTIDHISDCCWYEDFLITKNTPQLQFAQLPFDHPLFIMYSSGTTGVPKCIVHGAGGTLIQHLKEHRLHCDIKPEDNVFYFTTCGWMMWNWLASALASEATLVLYDGSPFYPEPKALIDMIDEEEIVLFGTSAKYIAALEKADVKPVQSHNLQSLRTILSTGSPLSHESFDYVYRAIKKDICLSSISGGTDILSCFVLGNPCLPVWQGQIQCRGLGMAVEIWNDKAQSVKGEKGELVCVKPFPSAPIYFWDDAHNKKYLSAYFERYPNIWAHGDYGEITPQDGIIIHGRSDAVLNPGGVRIGTAEIYRQVEKVNEVLDCVCVGQDWESDIRLVLFVVLRDSVQLDEQLITKIRHIIRRETTARHVPDKIIAVADIPRTISGKIVELAVRNIIHDQPVVNTDALANPDALELFKNLQQLTT